MKSQVAAEAVAAASLARGGWRPARGALKLVFVSDEETGGEVGAHWLTDTHPDRVRCDLLLNEGGGEVFEFGGRRRYGVCCAEKGIFRFKLTARGVAGHASLPKTGDNALLKLGPVLGAIAAPAVVRADRGAAALLRGLGLDPDDPRGRPAADRRRGPGAARPDRAHARRDADPDHGPRLGQDQRDPVAGVAKVDCRVPPGLGEDAVWRRIAHVLGEDADKTYEIEFTEQVAGNASPVATPLMDAIDRWIQRADPAPRPCR